MSGNIFLTGNAEMVANGTNSGSITGPITGPHDMIFNATNTGPDGTITLTGPNSYTGATQIGGGTVILGQAAQSPVLSGPGGAIVNHGLLVLDYSGGGTNPSSTVKSALTTAFASNFVTGQIRTTNTPDPTLGIGWKDDTTASQLSVKYTYFGDTNLDGTVDTSDFMTLSQNFNSTSALWQTGDFNYDGVVNALDFNAIATNFGKTVLSAPLPGGAFGTLVPEPAMFSIVLLSAGMLVGASSTCMIIRFGRPGEHAAPGLPSVFVFPEVPLIPGCRKGDRWPQSGRPAQR